MFSWQIEEPTRSPGSYWRQPGVSSAEALLVVLGSHRVLIRDALVEERPPKVGGEWGESNRKGP